MLNLITYMTFVISNILTFFERCIEVFVSESPAPEKGRGGNRLISQKCKLSTKSQDRIETIENYYLFRSKVYTWSHRHVTSVRQQHNVVAAVYSLTLF